MAHFVFLWSPLCLYGFDTHSLAACSEKGLVKSLLLFLGSVFDNGPAKYRNKLTQTCPKLFEEVWLNLWLLSVHLNCCVSINLESGLVGVHVKFSLCKAWFSNYVQNNEQNTHPRLKLWAS